MKTDLFDKEKVRIGLLSFLYTGATFCALVLRRYHQGLCFSETEMQDYAIESLPYPWMYYALFAIFSAVFFVLLFRKGLDSSKRNTFIATYAVTISTILLLYKIVIPLFMACFYLVAFIIDSFFYLFH